MPGTIINAVLVLIGSAIGLLLGSRISQRIITVLTHALALCVLGIGIKSAIGTEDALCVIVCMVVGTLIGEWIDIERRLDSVGESLQRRLGRGAGSRFTEGFVTSSILFCVGSMAIMGAMQAGTTGEYSILISKGVIDGVTAITFAATMGVGVACSILPLVVYQGGLTLLAAAVGPMLGAATITEMSAVGGTIIIGIAVNMLGLGKDRLRVGNMLPAIFLPILYLAMAV